VKRAACAVVLLLGILTGLALPAVGLQAETSTGVVKIGLVETITRGIPLSWTQIVMRPFKVLMEAQTALSSEVVSGGDAFALARDLHEDKVQVAVFHGHEYAWAKQKYSNLKIIALCVNRYQQAKVYLVVRSDSAARAVADLKGKKIAVPRMGRAPCRLYLERRCVAPGTTPEKFYARVETPFATLDALEDLVDGEVAAAVVDTVGLEDYRKHHAARARRLRCLAESEPFLCGVIAYHAGRFSEEKVARFRAGLLEAKSTAQGRSTLKALRLTAFELPPANHDALLDAIARAYPPPLPAK
jgi:ABC-type phosphate/phosphonate transport system substrate-binding protein